LWKTFEWVKPVLPLCKQEGEFQTRPLVDALPSEELRTFGPTDINYLTNFFKSGRKTREEVYIVEKKD